jgi:hypothetical protein
MTIDLTKILESKRTLRRELAAKSVAEKLRMLDAMRAHESAIRSAPTKTEQPPMIGKVKSR